MARSKKSSESNNDSESGKVSNWLRLLPGSREESARVKTPSKPLKDTFSLVEPQINAEGVHVWPFNKSCPVDVLFMTTHDRQRVRMNRHGYFEILYLCSGHGACHIQDRLLPFQEGDLAVIGSTLYHRIECQSESPLTIAALFFEPEFICCDGANDSAGYLTPFLLQDAEFPHVLPAKSGIPRKVLDLMLQIQSELPASTPRARLAVKTYLKMVLMLLVNQYAAYAGKIETLPAPGARARPVASPLQVHRRQSRQQCPGAPGRAHVRNERIVFYEFLQTGNRPVLCRLPESFPRGAGSVIAGANG